MALPRTTYVAELPIMFNPDDIWDAFDPTDESEMEPEYGDFWEEEENSDDCE